MTIFIFPLPTRVCRWVHSELLKGFHKWIGIPFTPPCMPFSFVPLPLLIIFISKGMAQAKLPFTTPTPNVSWKTGEKRSKSATLSHSMIHSYRSPHVCLCSPEKAQEFCLSYSLNNSVALGRKWSLLLPTEWFELTLDFQFCGLYLLTSIIKCEAGESTTFSPSYFFDGKAWLSRLKFIRRYQNCGLDNERWFVGKILSFKSPCNVWCWFAFSYT